MWKKSSKLSLWMLLDSCKSKTLINSYSISLQQLIPNYSEITFGERGYSKPFGKRLSPCAETPNHSGNDFRHARKHQTIREMTFAERGNAKPFGKRLSPAAEMPNLLKNGLREARKRQIL